MILGIVNVVLKSRNSTILATNVDTTILYYTSLDEQELLIRIHSWFY